jgi:hypothetical protein
MKYNKKRKSFMVKYFVGIANRSIDFDDFTKNVVFLQKCMNALYCGAKATDVPRILTKTILETAKTDMKVLSSMVNISTKAAVNTVTVISKTAIDVALSIKDWKSTHPTVEVIAYTTQQIQEEIEKFEELLDKMDLVKETYFATFNNIPMLVIKRN